MKFCLMNHSRISIIQWSSRNLNLMCFASWSNTFILDVWHCNLEHYWVCVLQILLIKIILKRKFRSSFFDGYNSIINKYRLDVPIIRFHFIGLMNAADYYGLEQLRKACTGFVQCCITVDTVCALLASAERYIQYKCTKSLVHKVSSQKCIKLLETFLFLVRQNSEKK